MTRLLDFVGVRRYGEDDLTPVVLSHRKACGLGSDHMRNGCIGLAVQFGGASGLIHLTTADALRLSDLLRAMASTNPRTPGDAEEATDA